MASLPAPRPAVPAAGPGTGSIIVERDAELARLGRVLREARDGAGATVLVEGAAGIGKTLLLGCARAEAARHGMEVLHAESGKEGIELLKRTRDIDLVLMDVMMPGLDGFDTMRIVRQLDGYRSLPIIAVTAKAMVGDREKCLEAGATDYIAKPVNVDVLIATLWRTVHGQAA